MLTVEEIIILGTILIAMLKYGNKVHQSKRHPQVVDIEMMKKLTKPYLLK